ncbi:Dynein regulatory complex subunit 6 [Entomophthora muscae]|uniref:Dynein regulatory complex subunit 6 n=1 Tax=Entomophthora muscae TaxID=34485 RepID=A0ACC2SB12_9FUNG|nr:Dynein regulatory complex subunit 6 [Entomophthora muscae]
MSQTCRTWRSILVRIPELWANISLDFSSSRQGRDKNKRQHAEFILQAFLSRANTRLRTIKLAHSPKLDWKWFSTLHQFPRPFLTQLDISNTAVSPPFLKPALKAFGTQLTHLTLASCRLTEDSVALLLSLCPSLIHLEISGLAIPSKELFLNARGDLRQEYLSLQWLGLGETDAGSDFIGSLGKVFPNLKGIDLNRVPNFRVPLLPQLCESLPNLTDISLQRMGFIFTDRHMLLSHFQAFGATYSMLTHLNLSYNFFLNDQLISCLSDSVSYLKVLDVSYTAIGEAGLSVFKNCPHLEYLNLSSCSLINDSAIIAFVNSLCIQKVKAVTNFIRELNLSSSSVNMFGLQTWTADPPRCLEHLRIKNCPMVSTVFVAKLRAAIPQARIHHSVPS